jgi:Mn2+/Fe2+ NRAMP family transporter
MLFSYPLMAAIQVIAGRIGRVSGRGIAGNMRRHYPRWLMYFSVLLMVGANVINLGADIGAMGAALKMLIGGPEIVFSALFAIGSLVVQATVPYHRYVHVLKWLTLVLFAYVATVFVVKVDWIAAAKGTFLPAITLKPAYLTALVGVMGTTISPYLFFWQASEEVEEIQLKPQDSPLRIAPSQAPFQLSRIKTDTYVGMAFSNLVAFFIILSVAATLHAHGITNIERSEDAAKALRPLAGDGAYLLFGLGIIGTGLLALPVLAGSAAYAVGESLKWPVGLERRILQAKGFYGVMAISILLGLSLNLFHVDPIKALFWSAVVNGVAAGPIMVTMMLMSSNKKVMGQFTINRGLKVMGWVSTAVMLVCSVLMFVYWGQ